ncbi:hypothetical protein HK096_004850 [Nowakowskiella sp. JEL0078]|nr:hypothetical protein HK096_004850 [Nowakowskiella sp. JEL0078]
MKYPAVFLDELVFNFFAKIYWPMNVVHPRSFMDNRYTRPKSLLYAICSVSCKLYNKGEFFRDTGRAIGEELFSLSMSLLDERESSLDYVCTLILQFDFAFSVGDAYLNVLNS